MRMSIELIIIFVNTNTGKTISLLVYPTDTIAVVKLEIQYREHILCNEHALIYNNMVLEDDTTLLDFNIYRNSTLMLMRKRKCKPRQFMSHPQIPPAEYQPLEGVTDQDPTTNYIEYSN
ncbi:putative Ubiquitin-like domain-containing protein [Helianthus anomalus]